MLLVWEPMSQMLAKMRLSRIQLWQLVMKPESPKPRILRLVVLWERKCRNLVPLWVGVPLSWLLRKTPNSPEQIDSIHNAVVNAIGARFDQAIWQLMLRFMKLNFGYFVVCWWRNFEWTAFAWYLRAASQKFIGIVLASYLRCFSENAQKFKPSDAEVQVLDEDNQQMLSEPEALVWINSELLNDLIQENLIMYSTALRDILRLVPQVRETLISI